MDVKFSKNSEKFLRRYDEKSKKRILEKIKNLAENPFPSDCKRVRGRKEKVFRVRVGNDRILYVVFNKENLLFVSDIDKRNRVYD
jgi:mRNA interferase RelE/StbE